MYIGNEKKLLNNGSNFHRYGARKYIETRFNYNKEPSYLGKISHYLMHDIHDKNPASVNENFERQFNIFTMRKCPIYYRPESTSAQSRTLLEVKIVTEPRSIFSSAEIYQCM